MAAKNPVTQPPKTGPFSKTTDFPDIKDLTYEQARDELISIVAELEGGQIGLENSMGLWQRGEALAAHCSTWLDGAEAKLTAQD
ncbi:MAG: exodeoxyribonuclease VII small subunit [Phycicoccus sp.]|nr:exodeoxyribonuclease VII small subunit [Phycicoccus sp.]NMM34565.1 exodeoxyribonuclease VII small subunit [Phycicoccus sp.]